MARVCPICKKRPRIFWERRKLRGKYNPTKKRRKLPNLQWAKIPVQLTDERFKEFAGKRIKICTKCLKTLYKEAK